MRKRDDRSGDAALGPRLLDRLTGSPIAGSAPATSPNGGSAGTAPASGGHTARSRRSWRLRSFGTIALAVGTALLTGCGEGGAAGGHRGVESLLSDYSACRDTEDYELVEAEAAELERTLRGEDRCTAAYVAGLAAYRAGAFDDAERHFLVAATAQDDEQVALAQASLGLVRLQQGRPADAADLVEEAYASLPATEQAEAARIVANMHGAAGDVAEARSWSATARSTPTLVGNGGYALQAGAFRERVRAERAARDTAGLPGAEAFGGVRILPKSGVGGTYFVVQLGRFATRQDAKMARDRLGRIELIVTDAL